MGCRVSTATVHPTAHENFSAAQVAASVSALGANYTAVGEKLKRDGVQGRVIDDILREQKIEALLDEYNVTTDIQRRVLKDHFERGGVARYVREENAMLQHIGEQTVLAHFQQLGSVLAAPTPSPIILSSTSNPALRRFFLDGPLQQQMQGHPIEGSGLVSTGCDGKQGLGLVTTPGHVLELKRECVEDLLNCDLEEILADARAEICRKQLLREGFQKSLVIANTRIDVALAQLLEITCEDSVWGCYEKLSLEMVQTLLENVSESMDSKKKAPQTISVLMIASKLMVVLHETCKHGIEKDRLKNYVASVNMIRKKAKLWKGSSSHLQHLIGLQLTMLEAGLLSLPNPKELHVAVAGGVELAKGIIYSLTSMSVNKAVFSGISKLAGVAADKCKRSLALSCFSVLFTIAQIKNTVIFGTKSSVTSDVRVILTNLYKQLFIGEDGRMRHFRWEVVASFAEMLAGLLLSEDYLSDVSTSLVHFLCFGDPQSGQEDTVPGFRGLAGFLEMGDTKHELCDAAATGCTLIADWIVRLASLDRNSWVRELLLILSTQVDMLSEKLLLLVDMTLSRILSAQEGKFEKEEENPSPVKAKNSRRLKAPCITTDPSTREEVAKMVCRLESIIQRVCQVVGFVASQTQDDLLENLKEKLQSTEPLLGDIRLFLRSFHSTTEKMQLVLNQFPEVTKYLCNAVYDEESRLEEKEQANSLKDTRAGFEQVQLKLDAFHPESTAAKDNVLNLEAPTASLGILLAQSRVNLKWTLKSVSDPVQAAMDEQDEKPYEGLPFTVDSSEVANFAQAAKAAAKEELEQVAENLKNFAKENVPEVLEDVCGALAWPAFEVAKSYWTSRTAKRPSQLWRARVYAASAVQRVLIMLRGKPEYAETCSELDKFLLVRRAFDSSPVVRTILRQNGKETREICVELWSTPVHESKVSDEDREKAQECITDDLKVEMRILETSLGFEDAAERDPYLEQLRLVRNRAMQARLQGWVDNAETMSDVVTIQGLNDFRSRLKDIEDKLDALQELLSKMDVKLDSVLQDTHLILERQEEATRKQSEHFQEVLRALKNDEGYFLYFAVQPPPVVCGAEKNRLEFESQIEGFKESLRKNQPNLLKTRSYPICLMDGRADRVREDLEHNKIHTLVWCTLGFGWEATDTESLGLQLLMEAKLPRVVMIVLKYDARAAAEHLLQSAAPGTIICYLQTDVFTDAGRQILSFAVVPFVQALHEYQQQQEQQDKKENEEEPQLRQQQQQQQQLERVGNVHKKTHHGVYETFLSPQKVQAEMKEMIRKVRTHLRDPGWNKAGFFGGNVKQVLNWNPRPDTNVDPIITHTLENGISLCKDTNLTNLRPALRETKVFSKDLDNLRRLKEFIRGTKSQRTIYIQDEAEQSKIDERASRSIGLALEACATFVLRERQFTHIFLIESETDMRDCKTSLKGIVSPCVLLWIHLTKDLDTTSLDDFLKHTIGHHSCCILVTANPSSNVLELRNNEICPLMIESMIGGDPEGDQLSERVREINLDGTSSMVQASPLHEELKLFAERNGETINLLNHFRSSYTQLVEAIQESLSGEESRPIAALYGDHQDTMHGESCPVLLVRVCISDVGFLHELRDMVIQGQFSSCLQEKLQLLEDDQNKNDEDITSQEQVKWKITVDLSHFAEAYEKSVFSLDQLTPHQTEKLRECEGYADGTINLAAPAGAGKTFVALHQIINTIATMEKKRNKPKKTSGMVLFIARNQALCMFVARWIVKRFDHKESDMKTAISRIHGLFEPLDAFPHAFKPEKDLIKLEKAQEDRSRESLQSYCLVIVDEAHHIFRDPSKRRRVESFVTPGETRLLLLSDDSQSEVTDISWPADMKRVCLTEVVRCSQRIVVAASAFQSGGSKEKQETSSGHGASGPPLRSYLFDTCKTEEERSRQYVDHTLEAFRHVFTSLPGLCLHDRLAFIVRDAFMREAMLPSLQAALKVNYPHRLFELVDAKKAAASFSEPHHVPLNGQDRRRPEWLVFDEISNFDGLERLIVICIGLDAPIRDPDGNMHETRSILYRGLTRAHMMASVVNESVPGGWLEFLKHIEMDENTTRFDAQAAREQTNLEAVSATLSDALETVFAQLEIRDKNAQAFVKRHLNKKGLSRESEEEKLKNHVNDALEEWTKKVHEVESLLLLKLEALRLKDLDEDQRTYILSSAALDYSRGTEPILAVEKSLECYIQDHSLAHAMKHVKHPLLEPAKDLLREKALELFRQNHSSTWDEIASSITSAWDDAMEKAEKQLEEALNQIAGQGTRKFLEESRETVQKNLALALLKHHHPSAAVVGLFFVCVWDVARAEKLALTDEEHSSITASLLADENAPRLSAQDTSIIRAKVLVGVRSHFVREAVRNAMDDAAAQGESESSAHPAELDFVTNLAIKEVKQEKDVEDAVEHALKLWRPRLDSFREEFEKEMEKIEADESKSRKQLWNKVLEAFLTSDSVFVHDSSLLRQFLERTLTQKRIELVLSEVKAQQNLAKSDVESLGQLLREKCADNAQQKFLLQEAKEFVQRNSVRKTKKLKQSTWETDGNSAVATGKEKLEFFPMHGGRGGSEDFAIVPAVINLVEFSCGENSGDWIQIAATNPLEDSCTKLHVKFKWVDQGWGHQKGRVGVFLVNDEGNDVASESVWRHSEEQGAGDALAPHTLQEVERTFEHGHPLVQGSGRGLRYVVKIIVGSGGGHHLRIPSFRLEADVGSLIAFASLPFKLKLDSFVRSDACDDWIEISSTPPLSAPCKRINVSFTWRDQGWGHQKGRLGIFLVDTEGNTIAAQTKFNQSEIAPHVSQEVSDTLVSSPIIDESARGMSYVVKVIVGGGGGHQLHVSHFEMSVLGTTGNLSDEQQESI